jgi:isoquinoline 1-oxidoreductase subunit beta
MMLFWSFQHLDWIARRPVLFIAGEQAPGTVARKMGDTDSAFKGAARLVEAEYHVPHLPHMQMEPVVAVARVDGDRCEVWAPTQNPQAAQTEVARVLGTTAEKVRVHVTFLGGGFGRKSKADFCSEAAFLSRRLGAPVRVQFTREDDVRHDYVNAVSTNRLPRRYPGALSGSFDPRVPDGYRLIIA